MRHLSLIAIVVLSLGGSAIAAEWRLWNRANLPFNFAPANGAVAPAIGTVEASTAIDGPAVEQVPAEAAPMQKGIEYGDSYGMPGGCSSCAGNGGYFSWFNGCCEREKSCCDNIWDNFCAQRKSWCNHHHKARCCQPACAPTCNTGCGGHRHGAWLNGAWMNGGSLFAGHGNGCSNCGDGEVTYGKEAIESEVPSTPAPATEPAPMPKLEPTPAPKPLQPKPMPREAFRTYFPSLRLMPATFGMPNTFGL